MELKDINSNDEIFLKFTLKLSKFFLIVKIAFKNKLYKTFFQEDA